jgi:hypothetical protein
MSTEEKKWTQEEWMRERLLEHLKWEARILFNEKWIDEVWDEEWVDEVWDDDELFQKITDENKWVDDELLRKEAEWRLRLGGKGRKLLEEFHAWRSKKEYEWRKIRDQQPKRKCEVMGILRSKILSIEHRMFMLKPWGDDKEKHERMRYRLERLCREKRTLEDIEASREFLQMMNWLAKEWDRYLEIRELMLRKTRSKDVTGVIMSFC